MEDSTTFLALADRKLYTAALAGAPVLFSCLAVGLVVGIMQAATSVNEQTLTFIPKLIATALVLIIFGASMLGLIEDFLKDTLTAIAHIGSGLGNV